MTDAGKKALEELVAGLDLTTPDKIADALEACDWVGVSIGIKCLARVSVEQFRKMSADRILAIAAYVATLENRVEVLSCALEQLHGPLSVATLEARATAAEERVKRLEAALAPYVKATKYNGAGAFALNAAMLSDTDHRTAHRLIVTEPALERAALAGDKP